MIKGSKMSEESKIKIRQSLIGNKRRLGIKHREDVKLKISKSHKGVPLSEYHRKRIGSSQIGRKHPEETIKKMSLVKIGNKFSLGKKWSKEMRLKRMGSNHPLWKGGNKKILNLIRELYEYRQWRSDVFTRDNYTCQICFKKGYKIEADHIKEFSLIIKENNIKTIQEALDCAELWNINNGRTLCKPCHNKTDNYGWNLLWKNNKK